MNRHCNEWITFCQLNKYLCSTFECQNQQTSPYFLKYYESRCSCNSYSWISKRLPQMIQNWWKNLEEHLWGVHIYYYFDYLSVTLLMELLSRFFQGLGSHVWLISLCGCFRFFVVADYCNMEPNSNSPAQTNNSNNRTSCKIRSNITGKRPEQCQRSHSGVFCCILQLAIVLLWTGKYTLGIFF